MNDNTDNVKCQEENDRKHPVDPMTFIDRSKGIEPMTFIDRSKGIDPMTPVDPSEKRTEFDRDRFLLNLRNQLDEAKRKRESATEAIPEYNCQYPEQTIVSAAAENSEGIVHRYLQSGLVKSDITANQAGNIQHINLLGKQVGVKNKKPKPIDLARRVKSALILCVKDQDIYVYINGYYKKMSQSDMEGVIWSVCKSEVEQVGNKSILTGAYQFLAVDPDLRVDNLQSALNVVPFRNGLVLLDTGYITQLTPSYFVTFTLNCEFPSDVARAECPAFDKYLEDVTGGDPLLIRRIWQFLGCCLTQDMNIKAIFVLQGISNSGKSVFVNLLKSFFPEDVKIELDVHSMSEQYAMVDCKGKVLCMSSDMESEVLNTTSVANLKKLSGRDTISSAVKYKSRSNFQFTGKVVMVTNHPLLLKQDDQAFWERIIVIPFRYQIPVEKRIYNLEATLMNEVSAIAAKALGAYFELRRNNYQFSGEYAINSLDMYPDSCSSADPTTMIFLYLQRHYEAWADGIVVLEEACNDFNMLNSTAISTQVFSSIFRRHAAELFGAVKFRTREGGYENARSAVKGIKRKFI